MSTVLNNIRRFALEPERAQDRRNIHDASVIVQAAAGINLVISSVLVVRSVYQICTANSEARCFAETIGFVGNVVASIASHDLFVVARNTAHFIGGNDLQRGIAVATPSWFANVMLQDTLLGSKIRPFLIDLLNHLS